MRRVKVVTGLNIASANEYPTLDNSVLFTSIKPKSVSSTRDADGEPVLLAWSDEVEVIHTVVPIQDFRRGFTIMEDDGKGWEVEEVDYIAYSPEVERYLGIPLNTLCAQVKLLQKELKETKENVTWYKGMWERTDNACKELCGSFWKRFKFLFIGKIDLGELEKDLKNA